MNDHYFNWLCRTCMHEIMETTFTNKERQQQQWKSIFDKVEERGWTLSIAELLSNTIPQIELNLEDNLSKKICHACLQQLTSMHSFQQMCIQSDREMRAMSAKMYANLIEAVLKLPAEEKEQEMHLLQQQQSDPLKNVASVTCRDFQDVGIMLKNEPCDDNDVCVATDNDQEALHSTINVEEEVISDHIQSTPLHSTIPSGSAFLLQQQEEVVTVATQDLSTHVCALCKRQFKTLRYLRRHLKRHAARGEEVVTETTRDSSAPVCDLEEEVISDHRQSTPLHSTIPSGSAFLLQQQQQQEEVVTVATQDLSTHVCALCKRQFKTLRYLRRHLKRHAARGEEVVTETTRDSSAPVCDLCKRQFKTSRLLNLHIKRHAAVKPCNVCEKTFISGNELRAHKIKEHTRKGYSCEICTKKFTCLGSLKNHLTTHTDERPFLCPECGKSFKAANTMAQHRLRHSDVRRFECSICPAKFHCSGDLNKHTKTHQGIKRHFCDICGDGFIRSYELTMHKRHHSGEKPFKCNYCEMRFIRLVAQKRHMLTHTGEKPYKCKYCERAFSQIGDKAKHLRTHLGENIYWCALCPSDFRSASDKRAHFVTHKNDDEETRERNMKALKDKEAKLELKLFKNKA